MNPGHELRQVLLHFITRLYAMGATTGQMMIYIRRNHHVLHDHIMRNVPDDLSDEKKIQHYKVAINNALDVLEELGLIVQDRIGKDKRQGDDISVPVWRLKAVEDSLADYRRWLLNPNKPTNRSCKDYPAQVRKKYTRPRFGHPDKTEGPTPQEFHANTASTAPETPKDIGDEINNEMNDILKWFDDLGKNLTGKE